MGACQSNTKASKPKQNPSDAQPVAVGDGGKTILAGEPVAKAEPNSESKETNAENVAGISVEHVGPSSEEIKQDPKKADGGEADAKDIATTAKEEEGAKAVGGEMPNDDVKGNVPITEDAQTATEKATGDAQAVDGVAPKDDMAGSALRASEAKPMTSDAKEDVTADDGGVPNDAADKGDSVNPQGENVNTVATEPKQDELPTEDENQVAEDDTSKRTVCSLLGFTC